MVRAVAALLLLPLLLGVSALPAQAGDPRWRFYTEDKTPYVSPWYARAHLISVPFGCTSAPYYSPDSRCSNGRGFHHGLDVAMKCGTRLFAGHRMWVMSNDSLGPAYGTPAAAAPPLFHVIGHTRTVYVSEGDLVKRGEALRAGVGQRRPGRVPPALREARRRRWPLHRHPSSEAAGAHSAGRVGAGGRLGRRGGLSRAGTLDRIPSSSRASPTSRSLPSRGSSSMAPTLPAWRWVCSSEV